MQSHAYAPQRLPDITVGSWSRFRYVAQSAGLTSAAYLPRDPSSWRRISHSHGACAGIAEALSPNSVWTRRENATNLPHSKSMSALHSTQQFPEPKDEEEELI
ncbi:hypothetical protein GN244_ATG18983, partial [Phytophthora infestans]